MPTTAGRLAEAVPRRGRTTFTELLLGAATTRGGHVTDAILAAGLSRSWTSYYWFLQRGRWAWLAVWRALLAALATLFEPPVWHVVTCCLMCGCYRAIIVACGSGSGAGGAVGDAPASSIRSTG